jgi:hypothetical protein
VELYNEIQDLEINLSNGKIKFVDISFEDWLDKSKEEEYWIYTTDCSRKMGVWKGLSEVSEEEREHFDEYTNDYFYYGRPFYVDRNDPGAEMTECELGFEGDCRLSCIRRCDI